MVTNRFLLSIWLIVCQCFCLIAQVSDNDGNSYATIKIGNQEWMAENLKTTKYSNGSSITYPGTNISAWQSNTNGAYAWYNNDMGTYKTDYGALYNWYAVNNPVGLCPTGWHIPSRAEFDELAAALGGSSVAGGKMKQIGLTYWLSPNEGATNESGFTGRGHGNRTTSGSFDNLKTYGEYWTLNEQDASTAWAYYLRHNYQDIGNINEWKENGFAVRCVKDNITTGLVAYYPFNGNTLDESGNANNGINHGATPTTDRFGNPNSAYSFDGADDFISVATSLIPTAGNEYTVSVWFNLNEIKLQEFISQWTYSNINNSFYLGMYNENFRFTDNWSSINIGSTIATDHWYNLVAIATPSNAYLYLNGNLVAEKGSPFIYTGLGDVAIGKQSEWNDEFVNGKIDDIRIYHRVLSIDEIYDLFHEGGWVDVLPGEYFSDSNTALLMHMNELSGSDVADAISNANNGTATGTTIVDGKVGKARKFQGTPEVIITNYNANFGTGPFTVELWVNLENFETDHQNLIGNRYPQNGNTWWMGVFADGSINFDGGSGQTISNPGDVSTGKWIHIAAVRNESSDLKIYRDGILVKTSQQSGGFNEGTNLSIGAINDGGEGTYGIIDEVRISTVARQPHEFNLQLPPKNLTASISGNGVTLSWENGGGYTDLQHYSIYRGTDSTNLTYINNTSATNFTDYLGIGGSYFYRVSAIDITGFESQKSYADLVFYDGLVVHLPFSGWAEQGTVNGAIIVSDRFFKDNSAFYFDGVDDDIAISPIDLSTSQQATFSAWIKPNAVDGAYEIIRQDGSPDFLLSFQGQILSFGLAAGGIYDELDVTINPSDFLDNRWHHITAVYDGSKKRLYRDAKLIGENSHTGYIVFSPGANTRIGSQGGQNEFFNGKIDEVRIYSRALSEAEIVKLYHENGYSQTADGENNTYRTVVIGAQEWFAENLKATKYVNGNDIDNITDFNTWASYNSSAFCWYNNDYETYGKIYGGLYNWYAVADERKICPAGWHVPADNEWMQMVDYLGGIEVAGSKLKEIGTTHWNEQNTEATNESGFTGLGGGARDNTSGFYGFNLWGIWRSSTILNASSSWEYVLTANLNSVYRYSDTHFHGFSVRCVRDVLGSGLVAQYPFDFNANDASGNGFNGTPSNVEFTTDRFDNGNHACHFHSNQSSHILVPIFDISGSNKVTVQAWVKLDDFTGSLAQIFWHNRFFMAFYPDGNVIRFNIDTESGSHDLDVSILSSDYVGIWHLITAVYDGNTQKIYSDGNLLGEVNYSSYFDYSDWGFPSIGSFNGESEFFNGVIDDVSILNRALSQDEIKRYYANYHPPKNLEGNAVQPGQNKLTWSSENIANYTKFRIYRNGNYYDQVAVSSANDTVYYDNGAVPNTTYNYTISSVDVLGYESIQSDPAQVFSVGNEVVFNEINAGLIGLASGSDAKWGDYNNDGLLDILISGQGGSGNISWIYKNNGDNTFTYQSQISITGVNSSSVDWADYDNDGFIDFIITGFIGNAEISRIYRNNGNETFTEKTDIDIVSVRAGCVRWGDYNNDGKQDFIITGDDAPDEYSSTGNITKIYRNYGNNSFTNQTDIVLAKVYVSSIAWGDYDNDNDLDLLLTGENPPNGPVSKIYRNEENNVFQEQTSISLIGVSESAVAWGDYDSDGDLDILISGFNGSSATTKIYRNNGDNTFTAQNGIALTGIKSGAVSWGDFDNDGDLDILLNGSDGANHVTKIFRNEGSNMFAEYTVVTLTGISQGSSQWGDYDGDGDLDILLTGQSDSGPVSKIYRNESALHNVAPSVPTNQNASVSGNNVTIRWNPATDNETPQQSITYNIRVGTSSGAMDIVSPHVHNTQLTVPGMGNAQLGNSFVLKNLEIGIYYWSVQAVDNGYLGSAWSTEKSFTVHPFDEAFDFYGVTESSSAWGDYDNDGDLDIIITGYYSTNLYRNDGNNHFTRIESNEFPMIKEGSVAWGDYDRDGDLDFLITGDFGSGKVSRIYRNDGSNVFVDIGAPFIGLSQSSAEWGDLDNDGDIDVLLTGNDAENVVRALIFRNNGDGSFSPISTHSIEPVRLSRTRFGDYDNDGDLDVLLIGWKQEGSPFTRIYRNQGNFNFQPMEEFGLTNIHHGSVDWGDYDCDGDLDIIICGHTGSSAFTRIYTNDGTSFSEQSQIPISALAYSSVHFGDYDNDGWADIVISGYTDGSEYLTHIFRNNTDGSFEMQSDISLPGTYRGSAEWCDFDNDGDLDLALTGESSSGPMAKIFRNNITKKNTPPTAPTGLNYSQNVRQINLWWSEPSEQETPWNSLTYNVRIGTSSGASDIVYPHSLSSGLLTVPARGNAASTRTFIVKNLAPGTYYWSVQAVDNGFAGGPWAEEQSFTVNEVDPFTNINAPLTSVSFGTCSWGDFDNDGDLDILLNGHVGQIVTKVYRNDGADTFTDLNLPLQGTFNGNSAWCDYDNDGDLDILVTGWYEDSYGSYVSKIYRNDEGAFNDSGIQLTGLGHAFAAWGDYNNDGFTDLIMAGELNEGGNTIILYKNCEGISFEKQTITQLQVMNLGEIAWGDYDNDGYLDILISGWDGGDNGFTKIYRNDGNDSFTEQTEISLIPLHHSAVAWGDYDGDGFLDFVVTGTNNDGNPQSVLYRKNTNGNFTEQNSINLTGVSDGGISWGDFDNDGDLDLLINGNPSSFIYSNNGDGTFSLLDFSFTGNSCAWGDYDSDGDLDILVIGGADVSRVYRNELMVGNTPPSTPQNLSVSQDYNGVLLSWSEAADAETASLSISYNVRVGTSPGGSDVVCPHALANGKLAIPALGNAQLDTSFIIKYLAPGTYYCSVQAVDNGYMGSSWADEQSFTVAEQFTEIDVGFENVAYGSSMWGDYNNDGYLDLITTGGGAWSSKHTKVYQNNGDNTFTEQTNISIPGVDASSVQWGDYNNDGFLDILITGSDQSGNAFTKIYRNNGDSTFTEISTSIMGTTGGALAWGDYDNDGDLDILLTGWNDAKIYRNQGNNHFAEQTNILLYGLEWSSVAWGDYDNDGFLDILISGNNTSNGIATKIYRNNQLGNFDEQTQIDLENIYQGSATWADYNNDGYLDVLLCGHNGTNPVSKIFKNNGDNSFSEQQNIALDGVYKSSASWGDYNNDGNIDILLSGDNGSSSISRIYMNNGNGTFSQQNSIILPGAIWGSSHWVDVDNDGDLDIFINGQSDESNISKLFINNLNIPNTPPLKPTNMVVWYGSSDATLTWDAATDSETPSTALTYNVRVGSNPGGCDIVCPHSLGNGKITISAMGNAQLGTTFTIKNLAEGTYYWSVQCVDNGFIGGEWAEENSFNITPNTISGQQFVCQNQNYVEYFVEEEEQVVYSWWVENGVVTDGNGTNSVVVTWGEGQVQGKVFLHREYSPDGYSRTDFLDVNIFDNKSTIPDIVKKGRINILICTYPNASSYKWFIDENPMSGATTQYYVARSNFGEYQVEIVNTEGCKGRSDKVMVTSSVLIDTPLVIYPNPGSGEFAFDIDCEETGEMQLTVTDSFGVIQKKIVSVKNEANITQHCNLSGLIKGVYVVTLMVNGRQIDSQKMVIL